VTSQPFQFGLLVAAFPALGANCACRLCPTIGIGGLASESPWRFVMHFRFTGLRAALLLVTAFVAGCDEGGDGTQAVYFSSSNYQGCATEYVSFHSRQYGELVRKDDGNLDCTLSPLLTSMGCTLTLRENDSNDAVGAVVDHCRVPNNANLFSCVYRNPDFFALNTEEGANCGCLAYEDSCYVNGICDMCASRDAERGACEDCNNNLDDDDDGRTDCDDHDCQLTDDCGFGRTTVTCSSTTTTTTTSTSTSTVTIFDQAPMSRLPASE
jgi:hypothetical protein